MSSLRNSYSRVAEQGNENAVSEVFPVSGDILLPILFPNPHSFAGVVYYANASGDTPLDPSGLGGTATITIRTTNQPHGFQATVDNVLMANAFSQTSWDGNATEVKAVFAAITGATHARLIVTSNKT